MPISEKRLSMDLRADYVECPRENQAWNGTGMIKKYPGQCACGAVKFEFDTDPTFYPQLPLPRIDSMPG